VKAFINQRFLHQTQFDSAAPTGTAVVAHEFEQDGSYELAVARKDKVVSRVPIVVTPRRPVAAEAAEPPAAQAEQVGRDAVSVDLSKLMRPGTAPPELLSLAVAGWVSFTSSQPAAGHHVVVRRVKREQGKRGDVFDSRRLDKRSLFAVTLLQPGRYSLQNAIGRTKAEIVVSYPQVGDVPYRPPAPLQIEVTKEGFGEKRFTLSPAQGIVFRFRTESRIQIKLIEPDEGPPRERRPQARFAKTPGFEQARRGRAGS
jgi:hypothetical protein